MRGLGVGLVIVEGIGLRLCFSRDQIASLLLVI